MEERFVIGDKVDWRDEVKESEMAKEVGPGPFFIRGIEHVVPDANGHCQWLSLKKEVDGLSLAWVSHKKAWIEDKPGPPYKAVPPTFSNLSFIRLEPPRMSINLGPFWR